MNKYQDDFSWCCWPPRAGFSTLLLWLFLAVSTFRRRNAQTSYETLYLPSNVELEAVTLMFLCYYVEMDKNVT